MPDNLEPTKGGPASVYDLLQGNPAAEEAHFLRQELVSWILNTDFEKTVREKVGHVVETVLKNALDTAFSNSFKNSVQDSLKNLVPKDIKKGILDADHEQRLLTIIDTSIADFIDNLLGEAITSAISRSVYVHFEKRRTVYQNKVVSSINAALKELDIRTLLRRTNLNLFEAEDEQLASKLICSAIDASLKKHVIENRDFYAGYVQKSLSEQTQPICRQPLHNTEKTERHPSSAVQLETAHGTHGHLQSSKGTTSILQTIFSKHFLKWLIVSSIGILIIIVCLQFYWRYVTPDSSVVDKISMTPYSETTANTEINRRSGEVAFPNRFVNEGTLPKTTDPNELRRAIWRKVVAQKQGGIEDAYDFILSTHQGQGFPCQEGVQYPQVKGAQILVLHCYELRSARGGESRNRGWSAPPQSLTIDGRPGTKTYGLLNDFVDSFNRGDIQPFKNGTPSTEYVKVINLALDELVNYHGRQ